MTAVLAFLLMLVIVAAMSIGVMFGRKPIAGSCGGMKALGMNMECEICGGDPNACDSAGGAPGQREAVRRVDAASLGSNATCDPREGRTRTL